MDIKKIMENISEDNLRSATIKKSILIEKTGDGPVELKADNSRAQIQWKDEVPNTDKEDDSVSIKHRSSYPVLGILASRGYRWHYIHDAMLKLRCEELKAKMLDSDSQGVQKKVMNLLIQDLGSGVFQKRYNKNADLTLDQQTQLELLKYRIKAENDSYMRRHPEIDIMIKLIYAALFLHRPEDPQRFILEHVHYLNKHREDLVVEDFDVPFDRPEIPEELTSEEEERRQIRDFARQIVERCCNLAALGQSYVDVMGLINSMLKTVSPSEDGVSVQSSISNAETAVSKVLYSLLTSVAIERSTSGELAVDHVMEVIVEKALPHVRRDSPMYAEMRESVDIYIHELLQQMTERALTKISIREIMGNKDNKEEETIAADGTRSILKKVLSMQEDDQKTKTKVKFQSLQA